MRRSAYLLKSAACLSAVRKDEWARAGERSNLAQDGNSLTGERHVVRVAHLHALGRNAALRGVEINLRPLSGTQLTRSKENNRCKLQGVVSRGLANIVVNCPEEFSHSSRFSNCGAVLYLQRRKSATEIGGGISVRAAGSDRISEYLTRALLCPMRCFNLSASFQLSQGCQ